MNRGVAVGSSIGHAIGGFFGGGSSAPAAEAPAQDNGVAAQGTQANNSSWGARSCEVDAKQFTKCMDDNQGNMQICNWYLEQLVSGYFEKLGRGCGYGTGANENFSTEGMPASFEGVLGDHTRLKIA
jgi:hypothetical protein